MNTEVCVHLAYGQLALCCCVYSMSALINSHSMVDRTPQNVAWRLGGTLLLSDAISSTQRLSPYPPLRVLTAVFTSRQIKATVHLRHPFRVKQRMETSWSPPHAGVLLMPGYLAEV